jgi:hypothetical protein
MATQKQIEANRRNAQKSTGPVTEAGKTKARFNALKHGMTAKVAVLPHEDAQSYEQLRQALIEDYQPSGAGEETLVELVAVNYWRLLRARRLETSSFDLQVRTIKRRHGMNSVPTMDDDGSLAAAFTDPGDTLRNLDRYQNGIERAYLRAVEALRRAQSSRLKSEKRPAATSTIGSVSLAEALGAGVASSGSHAQRDRQPHASEVTAPASIHPFAFSDYRNDPKLL